VSYRELSRFEAFVGRNLISGTRNQLTAKTRSHLYQRPAVDHGVAQPRDAVHRPRPRNRQQRRRRTGQEADSGGGVASGLFVAETNVADAGGLQVKGRRKRGDCC
jgi:hypothetical protein